MTTTAILVFTIIAFLISSNVFWAMFLRWGLIWTRAQDVTAMRVLKTTIVVFLANIASHVLLLYLSTFPDSFSQLIVVIGGLVGWVAIPCVVIGYFFQIRFWRAFLAWLPTHFAGLAVVVILTLFRPFVFEGFTTVENDMSPTLLGAHLKDKCPVCRRSTYCTPETSRWPKTVTPYLMVCDNFHVSSIQHVSKKVHAGDRFLVAKFLSPNRWDLATFEDPENPSMLIVKRVVGLPGERVHIRDGTIWINEESITPPLSIQEINYVAENSQGFNFEMWGTENRPAQLGNDEYFVLGDFPAKSYDSRHWQEGFPGHSPFAIPASKIKGVVTHTYWPLHRWRVHR